MNELPTKCIEIVKDYSNSFGTFKRASPNRADNITRVPHVLADKMIAAGIAVDLHRNGNCLFALRLEISKGTL